MGDLLISGITYVKCMGRTNARPDFYSLKTDSSHLWSSPVSFRLDYVPHAVIPREPKVKCVYVPPEGLMRMTTTYTEDFHRHTVTPCNRVTKVSNYQPSTGKMDTLSTYKGKPQQLCVECVCVCGGGVLQ